MDYHGKHGDKELIITDITPTPGKVSLPIPALHKIIHDRLEYARYYPHPNAQAQPISNVCDIEALTQNTVYEIERALGLHPEHNN